MSKSKRKRKSRMGRPPLPPDKRRAVAVAFRITVGEHKAVLSEARRRGVSVPDVLMAPWREGTDDASVSPGVSGS